MTLGNYPAQTWLVIHANGYVAGSFTSEVHASKWCIEHNAREGKEIWHFVNRPLLNHWSELK